VFEAIAKTETCRKDTATQPPYNSPSSLDSESCAVPFSMDPPKPLKVIRRRKSQSAVVFVTSPKIIPHAMLIGVEKEVRQED
jgi:hypothetical protein